MTPVCRADWASSYKSLTSLPVVGKFFLYACIKIRGKDFAGCILFGSQRHVEGDHAPSQFFEFGIMDSSLPSR